MKNKRYFPSEIESKWQERWSKTGLYKFSSKHGNKSHSAKASRGKYYNLVELPYPSGDLHMGHWFAFVPADAHARYKKMAGFDVFFPNGFDAFGLPAENAAIQRGIHPKDWTMKNIETMRKQFDTMGTMIDWNYSVITCLPEYYRWNQWIFLKMFEKGIAYRGKTLSNWCPVDKTVLANEHIEQGRCWRCGAEVIQKEVEQWFLKITDYAERLIWPEDSNSRQPHLSDDARSSFPKSSKTPRSLSESRNSSSKDNKNGETSAFSSSESGLPPVKDNALENQNWPASHASEVVVGWPKQVREGQNNWIGKSEGMLIEFKIEEAKASIEVFTTRPETADGATFLVLSPEHPFVTSIPSSKNKGIKDYVEAAKKKTEMERKEDRTKSGKFSGRYVRNPVTGKDIPVWISDYVLAGYGTGAIMAVPFADERDREFAEKFQLPIEKTSFKAKPTGKKMVNYHLRDWSVSRQRYWGTPVPIIYCKNCARGPVRSFPPANALRPRRMRAVGSPSTSATPFNTSVIDKEEYAMVPVPYEDLPVELPYNVDYTPKGKPPLASDEEWLNVKCPKCKDKAKRDAETLDTFFDSAWYFYRYVSPEYQKEPFDRPKVKKLLPVDVYFGGSEHTLGHTLYARFFTKFFKDLGLVSFDEFAHKRVQHGVILGPDGNRMSKSRGNVVNPDDIVKEYGADTVRLYLCFMMPYEATSPWSQGAISGVYRFLKRVWSLFEKVSEIELSQTDLNKMHKAIKKVGDDLNNFQFNTAVAQLMTWLNFLDAKEKISLKEYEVFLKILSPFAPHITEELWQSLSLIAKGQSKNRVFSRQSRFSDDARSSFSNNQSQTHSLSESLFSSIHQQEWPEYDEKYLTEDEISIAVQVNGKLRDTIRVESSKLKVQSYVEEEAKKSEKVKKYLTGSVKKVIYVEAKIVNFVISN